MKIHQILVTLAYGDGVGNDVIAIYNMLKRHRYETDIFAVNIDSRIQCMDLYTVGEMQEFADEDLIIYHLSIGTDLNELFPQWKGRKIIRYHNITPPQWFEGIDKNGIYLCTSGLVQAKKLAKSAEYCIAVSEFNKRDLISMGYRCPIDVLPIVIPFEDYEKEPDWNIVDKLNDDYINILFTGRIAPNKKQQDIISAFAEYQKKYNFKSRLLLVGAYAEESTYYQEVKQCVEISGAQNVIFTGHIPFEQILSYYHAADLFLCMSEHEGFCIPLLEAMYFHIPIVAFSSTAVPGTLNGSGVLFEEKNYEKVAALINHIISDEEYRKRIIEGQNLRLQDFKYEKIESEFLKLIQKYLEA